MNEDKLLHLLRKKRGFFETVLDLTHNEAGLPVSEWIATLEQKKTLLVCIEEIDKELNSFKQTMSNVSQEISEELENTQKIIFQILHLDNRNHEKRKKEFGSSSSELI